MPQVPSANFLAILVCGIASMIIGYLWYGPVFGKMWMGLMGIVPDQITEAKKKEMAKSYILMFIGSLVMAYILNHIIVFAGTYLKTEGFETGLSTAFWVWLGFIAPVTMGTVLWEGKSWKLWFLNNGYQLITLLVMGVILAMWK